jgi:hypothetical protein
MHALCCVQSRANAKASTLSVDGSMQNCGVSRAKLHGSFEKKFVSTVWHTESML